MFTVVGIAIQTAEWKAQSGFELNEFMSFKTI